MSVEFLSCDFCGNPFIKGRGHKCWCPDCKTSHPMCETCYQEGKKSGKIKDRKPSLFRKLLQVIKI